MVRTTLTNTVQVGGSIGYDGSYTVAALRGGGVYTWLPEPGEVIKQDQPVYSVSDEPVPLLYGSIPAYREFDAGMSDGADVGQLTHDLIALGYGAGLTQSNHYSSATAAAVQRWQSALGLQATGEIPLGEVVFEPGPIRVTSVAPSAGAPVGGGGGGSTVLTATSTTPSSSSTWTSARNTWSSPAMRCRSCCPTAPRRWAGASRRSAPWPPAQGRERHRRRRRRQRLGGPVAV